MRRAIASFDVFDTCLTRTVSRPADVFAAAALFLRAQGKIRFADHDLADVARLRVRAETLARQALRGREDLDLAAICARIPADNPWGLAPRDAYDAELAVETSCLRPVAATLTLVRTLREQGRRIVFVTDMYLPAAFLAERLAAHGFYAPGDGLYVSGEVGLCKWSGRLFRHVLDREGVAPRQVLHVGDNAASDGIMARRCGIRTRRVTDALLTPREAALDRPQPDRSPCAAVLAGAARAGRAAMGDVAAVPADLAAVVAAVAAPLFLTFTAWVLTEAAKADADRLHFVARDGQIFYRLAAILRRNRPELPEPRYLHGSRQAWFLPALARCTREELGWLVVPGHDRRPAALLAKLGLTPEELPATGPDEAPGTPFWSTPLPPDGEDAFFALVTRSPNAQAIEARAATARTLATAYFRDIAQGRPRLFLVDLGWTLSTQAALERLLAAGGLDVALCGYYFGLSASRVCGLEGRCRAFLQELPRGCDPAESHNPLFRNANLLEQCLTLADHGQTMGYAQENGVVRPVLRQARPEAVRLAAGIQRIVCAVAEDWAAQATPLALPLEALAAQKPAAVANALAFLRAPTRREAAAFGGIAVWDDQNESRARALARPLGLADWLRTLPGLGALLPAASYETGCDWLEGSIALAPAWLRPLLRRPRAFEALRALRKSL